MQISIIFALFVGTIIIVHFLDLIAKRLRVDRKKKELPTKRKDWYCFFSPQVLLGKDSIENPVVQDIQQTVVRESKLRRLQERRRPVLKA